MLKIQLLYYLFCVFFVVPSYHLTGRLVDHQYNPVTYFIIETYASNQQRESLSLLRRDTIRNNNGEFKINALKNGSYLLKIAVPDYTDYSLFTTIQDSSYSFPEVHLQPTK